jgi:hypothetical protein
MLQHANKEFAVLAVAVYIPYGIIYLPPPPSPLQLLLLLILLRLLLPVLLEV